MNGDVNISTFETEMRILWAWAREASCLSDLPEVPRWDEDADQLRWFDRVTKVSGEFHVQVIHRGAGFVEKATIEIRRSDEFTATEEMAIPADITAAARAIRAREG